MFYDKLASDDQVQNPLETEVITYMAYAGKL